MSFQIYSPGGYRYVPGVFQYSAGVAAETGYAIHRVTFIQMLGFDWSHVTTTNVYTVHQLPKQILDEIHNRTAAPHYLV